MLRQKLVLSIVTISLMGLLITSPSYSQQEQREQRGQRGGQQGQRGEGGQRGQRGGDDERGQRGRGQDQNQQGRGRQRSEQRQSETERMQERLGATDQEWTVLGPRVMKVSELSRQLRGGRQRGGSQGGRGRQRGGSQDAQPDNRQNTSTRESSALEKAQEQLRTLLNNTLATPDQIKKQLTAVRTAKAKATQQLAVAQTDLRQVITVRQEAQLVMMNMLD